MAYSACEDDLILVERIEPAVARVILNRPEKRNAFNAQMIAALTEQLQHLDADHTVRMVILTAAGEHFCAGADIGWMQQTAAYTYEENLADAQALATLMHTLYRLRQPTLAVVQGAVYGGGVGLVACCDIVLASQEAQLCLSEVKLGLIPAVISPYVLQKIGISAMQRYALTAEVISAATALTLGLVHEVLTDKTALLAATDQFIERLKKNGPQALVATKMLLHKLPGRAIDEALSAETVSQIAALRVTDEAQSGCKAFLEKRKPSWCE